MLLSKHAIVEMYTWQYGNVSSFRNDAYKQGVPRKHSKDDTLYYFVWNTYFSIVRTYQILFCFAETEHRSRIVGSRVELRPVSGVDHQFSVGEEGSKLEQEVFNTRTSEGEHAVL